MDNLKTAVSSDLSEYILQEKLGSGSFGKVYKVKNKNTNIFYAAKISIEELNEDTYDLFMSISREVNIVSRFNHPSVLKFILYSPINFKKKQKPVIITEYASNGSLLRSIEHDRNNPDSPILNDTCKLIIIYGIASAMSYLHSNEIIHRDLKTDNVLLDDFLLPKVADFGLSKSSSPIKQSAYIQTKADAIKGTPIYIAPEIWDRSYYSKSGDVYAFAIVVFEIMTCQKPYPSIDIFNLALSVKRGQRPKFEVYVPEAYKYLIERCWSQQPENRPTFDQILTELRTDRSYITETVNEEVYFNYIKFIDEYETTFDSTKVVVPYSNFTKYKLNWEILNNEIQLGDVNDNIKLISLISNFPYKYLKYLGEKSKQNVIEAKDDSQLQFEIGRNLIEGRYDFPIDLKIGLDFIKKSMNNGNKDSLIYCIKMLIKGALIPHNHKKVQKLIESKLSKDDSLYSLLYGQLYKKEKQFSKAEEYFKQSMNLGNSYAIYEYAELLRKGYCQQTNQIENSIYYQKAIEKGNLNAIYKYGVILNNENKKEEGTRLIKIAVDEGYLKALYYYGIKLEEEKDNKNDELIIDCFKKAANEGHVKSMNKYGFKLIDILSEDEKKDEPFRYLKKASDKGCFESMYKCGDLIMDKQLKVQRDMKEGVRYTKISAYNGISKACTLYGYLLKNGIGVEVDYEKAIKFYKLAIDKGDSSAMNNYGHMLYNGFGVEVDHEEAKKYFKMAIEKGSRDAMNNYAYALEKEEGKDVDYKEVIKYYKMAIDKGLPNSMNNYALMLKDGRGVERNMDEAIKYLKMSIDKGHAAAMNNLAYILQNGQGVEKNIEEAVKYYKMAIDKGNTDAMNNYALMLLFGNGVKANTQEGIKYLKMGIDHGCIISMNSYAHILQNGIGIEKNYKEAIKYYKILIDRGLPAGMHNYAYMLQHGLGIDVNYSEAIKYYKMAIDKGVPNSMNYYALMLQNGEGCEVDYKEAMKYYQMAINKGFPPAMNNYANMLEKGLGVEVNKEEAVKYYKMAIAKNDKDAMLKCGLILCESEDENIRKEGIEYITKASDLKNVEAQSTLALKYLRGDCVPYDKEKGLKLYKMSAKNGNVKAQINLGYVYRKGYKRFVQKNNKKAIKYYSMAASKGNKFAQFNLGVLYLKGDDDVPIDIEKSIHFLKSAADQNDLDAELNLGVLYAKEEEEIHSSNFNKSSSIFKKLAKLSNSKSKNNLAIIHSKENIIKKETKDAKEIFISASEPNKISPARKVDEFLFEDEKELDENEFELCHLYAGKRSEKEDTNRFCSSSSEKEFENLYEFLLQKINRIRSFIVDPISLNTNGIIRYQLANIGLTDCINTYTKVNYTLQKVEKEIQAILDTNNEENTMSHLPLLNKEASAQKIVEKEDDDNDDNEPNSRKIKIVKRHVQFDQKNTNDEDNSKKLEQAKLISNQPNISINTVNEPLSDHVDHSPRKKVRESNCVTQKADSNQLTLSPQYLKNRIKILERKSDEGDAISQMQLGSCYSLGEGVSCDESIALDYYLKAANQGNKEAQFIVGTYYSYGKGTEVDKDMAFQFYLKSAEQGYHKAQFAVGHFYYYHKDPTVENNEKALEWYKKAASQGNRAAIKAIQSISNAFV